MFLAEPEPQQSTPSSTPRLPYGEDAREARCWQVLFDLLMSLKGSCDVSCSPHVWGLLAASKRRGPERLELAENAAGPQSSLCTDLNIVGDFLSSVRARGES